MRVSVRILYFDTIHSSDQTLVYFLYKECELAHKDYDIEFYIEQNVKLNIKKTLI